MKNDTKAKLSEVFERACTLDSSSGPHFYVSTLVGQAFSQSVLQNLVTMLAKLTL